MRFNLFHIVLIVTVTFLIIVSFFFRDSTEAMVAIVESQRTAVSYQKPVIIKKIHVVPGQDVEKGDLLIEVLRPDLDLDLEKLEAELQNARNELVTLERKYHNDRDIRSLEYQTERMKIRSDLELLSFEMEQETKLNNNLSEITNKTFIRDSSKIWKYNELQSRLVRLQSVFNKGNDFEAYHFRQQEETLNQQIQILELEMNKIQQEYNELSRFAKFGGTIGSVNVQLEELIPPYRTLLNIYESKPTLIKAFMNERISYQVNPGDTVWVQSGNRTYKVPGQVMEIGSRITAYPEKINETINQKSYGQEVFIEISENNNFLNGEKVYVYPFD